MENSLIANCLLKIDIVNAFSGKDSGGDIDKCQSSIAYGLRIIQPVNVRMFSNHIEGQSLISSLLGGKAFWWAFYASGAVTLRGHCYAGLLECRADSLGFQVGDSCFNTAVFAPD